MSDQAINWMRSVKIINVKKRSFSVTADIEITASGATGVVPAQGGRFGGWSLWLQDGRPRFSYNWLGVERDGFR
jgi:arylsulfatase